jgi:hypothetical protein
MNNNKSWNHWSAKKNHLLWITNVVLVKPVVDARAMWLGHTDCRWNISAEINKQRIGAANSGHK